MKTIGIVLAGLVCLALLIALAFGLEMGGLKWKGFFAPKHEAVRREVFKQTRSYNEGKEQELLKLYREYKAADSADRPALAAHIRMGFADYDESLLTPEIATFLKQMKYGD